MTTRIRIPNRGRSGAVAAAALLLAVWACGPRIRQVDVAAGFDPAALTGARVAVCGAVLGPRAELDRTAAFPGLTGVPDDLIQCDRWAPVLYGALMETRPDIHPWPWDAVGSQLPTDRLMLLLDSWGGGGSPDPKLVQELGRYLPGVGYLALARIEGNEVITRQSLETTDSDQRVRDGRDVHGGMVDRTMNVQRKVTVALEIFAAETGLSVWFAEGTADRRALFNAPDLEEAPAPPPLEGPEGTRPVIDVQGAPVKAPDFDAVFGDACRALLAKLPRPDGPGGN